MSGSSRPEGNGGSTPSLFLGNLSMFVTEKDIQDLFDRHLCNDDIECKYSGVKIIRTDKSVSLGYGFVNMRSEAEAEEALATLNGKQFHGRPLQVNWAVRNIKKSPSTSEVDHPAVNSVHVKFSTLNRGPLVTEETILHYFAKHGDVKDVFIKYSCFNKVTGLQKGYAFVHFSDNVGGRESAMISASEVTGNSSVRFECQPSKNLLKQLRDDEGETKFIGRDKKVYQTPKNNGSLKAVADRSLQSIPQPIFAVGPSSGPESITGSTAPSALLAAARNSSSHFSAGSSLSNSGHGYGSSNDSVATVSNVIYPLSPCLSSQPASSLLILSMECLNDSEENISTDLRTSSGKLPPGRTNMAYGAQVPSQGQNIPIPPESNDLPHASASTAYNSNGYFLGAQHQIQEGLYQQYQQQQQRQQQLYQYPNVYEPYQIRSNGHRQMPDRSIYYGPVQTQYQSHVLPHQVPIMPQLQSEEFIYASQGGSIPLPGIPIPIGYTVHNPGYNEVSTNQRIMYPSVPVFSTPSVGVHYGYYPYTQHLGQNNDGTVSVSPVAYSYSTSTSGSETPVPGTYTPVSVAYTSHSRSPAEYNSVPVLGDGTSQHRSYQSTDPSTVSNDTNQQQPLQNKSKKKKMPNDVVKKRFYRGP